MNIYEHAMMQAINAARTSRGVHALAASDLLAAAAARHAQDMATHPGIVHVGSDGSSIEGRIRAAGYAPVAFGEVVAWGWAGEVAPALEWWLNSPEHVGYVLSPEYTEMGVGYATGLGPWSHYWAVDFGRPVAPPPAPPRPYTSHVPIVVGGTVAAGLALLDYLRGDGRAYRVGNGWGTFEVFQTQTEDDRFYQVKAWNDLSVVNYEEFIVTPEYIGRDIDTSPGGGRFYRQFAAPWVKRRMRIGESFTAAKRVQFYRADDCAPIALHSGSVTDTITLVEHLAEWRSRFGVELRDVIRLRWEQGGEDYYYARGLGMVAWRRAHNDAHSPEWSAISEMRPDVGRLRRLAIPCL